MSRYTLSATFLASTLGRAGLSLSSVSLRCTCPTVSPAPALCNTSGGAERDIQPAGCPAPGEARRTGPESRIRCSAQSLAFRPAVPILQSIPSGILSDPTQVDRARQAERGRPRGRDASNPGFLAEPSIYVADLLHPAAPVLVLHLQDLLERPVKVVGDVGYLLEQAVKGVACYAPPNWPRSTSNS